MAENFRNPRLEEDDYELQRLRKRRKRQHEAYLKKKRREKVILITAAAVLITVALSVTAGVIRRRRTVQGDFNDPTRTNPESVSSGTGTSGAASAGASAEGTAGTEEEETTREYVTLTTGAAAPETEPSSSEDAAETPAEAPETSETEGYQELTGQGPETVYEKVADIPSWITKDLLHISEKNRPGTKLGTVNNVVIHWVGNATSTAKDNRDYFESLANPKVNTEGIGASSHFIVGLEGEIIQCVPIEEVSYANYPRNYDTITIEVCHPDWEGKFSDVTYASVIKLAAWVLEIYGLTADDLMRHYDVRGKECPLYYVQHPDAWEQLKADVRQYMSEHPDIANEFP